MDEVFQGATLVKSAIAQAKNWRSTDGCNHLGIYTHQTADHFFRQAVMVRKNQRGSTPRTREYQVLNTGAGSVENFARQYPTPFSHLTNVVDNEGAKYGPLWSSASKSI